MNRVVRVAVGCVLLTMGACVQIPGMTGPPPTPQAPYDARPVADMQARMNAAPNTSLPPVTSLSCEQMLAELSTAGAKMSGQIDPSMAANAKEIQKAMQSQKPMTQAEADRHRAITNQNIASMAAATQGIDMQRMAALDAEFSARKCKTPQ